MRMAVLPTCCILLQCTLSHAMNRTSSMALVLRSTCHDSDRQCTTYWAPTENGAALLIRFEEFTDVFSADSCVWRFGDCLQSRVEAGPASRRRRRKWNPASGGYNWATLFLGDINTGTWPSRLGSLESERVKYGRESRGTRTWEWLRWRGPAGIVNDRPILSSERMLHKD
jgi:hypothetical protein